jgi:hypothetical protein
MTATVHTYMYNIIKTDYIILQYHYSIFLYSYCLHGRPNGRLKNYKLYILNRKIFTPYKIK